MGFWIKVKKKIQRLEFTRGEQLAFLQDLSALIQEGVVATLAVDTIAKISKGVIRAVALDIGKGIAQGQGISGGMQYWFPRAVYEIIRAGEESGTLLPALLAATESFRKSSNTVKELINSLLYPLTVLSLALIVVVFVKTTVLESFVQIKPISSWPGIGQHLYYFAYLLETWWWFYLTFIALVILIIAMVLRNVTGKARVYIDSIPLLSLYRSSVAAQFMETLGILITNGVVLKRAFDILHKDAAPYLSWHLFMMEYRLSGGKDNIADVLDTQLISENDLLRLRVIAQGKGFEQALLSLGRQASRKTSEHISRVSKIVGGLMLVMTAMLAMFIVAGIYDISSILALN